MHKAILFSFLLSSSSLAADMSAAVVFHIAHFEPGRTVSLRLIEHNFATDPAYDFDAVVGLSEADGKSVVYTDPVRHHASVRCAHPALVRAMSVDYLVNTNGTPGKDWKRDLWAVLCSTPIS
jgi:hypothetical protein